jgi:hypothetical protein
VAARPAVEGLERGERLGDPRGEDPRRVTPRHVRELVRAERHLLLGTQVDHGTGREADLGTEDTRGERHRQPRSGADPHRRPQAERLSDRLSLGRERRRGESRSVAQQEREATRGDDEPGQGGAHQQRPRERQRLAPVAGGGARRERGLLGPSGLRRNDHEACDPRARGGGEGRPCRRGRRPRQAPRRALPARVENRGHAHGRGPARGHGRGLRRPRRGDGRLRQAQRTPERYEAEAHLQGGRGEAPDERRAHERLLQRQPSLAERAADGPRRGEEQRAVEKVREEEPRDELHQVLPRRRPGARRRRSASSSPASISFSETRCATRAFGSPPNRRSTSSPTIERRTWSSLTVGQ